MPRTLPVGEIVVDAAFVMALLLGETLATRFTSVLSRAVMVDVNLAEVFCAVDRRRSTSPADVARVLGAQGLRVVPLGIAGAAIFPLLAGLESRRPDLAPAGDAEGLQAVPLSLAAMACLSVAIDRQLPVLTGDAHWPGLGLALRIDDYRDPELLAPA
ncbi:MAG TPA: hypothetical protein VND70_01800 [Acidimicrobiales bacterium]|nr:hypothetical protein [Acidimicrobiales bacterium]